MVMRTVLLLMLLAAAGWGQAGTIRGVVYDADFDVPLGGVTVTIVETGQKAESTDQGNYQIPNVAPGQYTLIFAKDGFSRSVKQNVGVAAGRLKDLDVQLAGEFSDLEDYVVQKPLEFGAGTEETVLQLRMESASLLDAIGAELISQSGASDAAGALRLIPGATVKDGKSAVIRGLPDRYVSSQLNGVRLPTADEDKRAVELDQFPSVIIENLNVSKTFTPDQQGDASGGAVDVRLRGRPTVPFYVDLKSQISFNNQVAGEDFLTYDDGGFSFFGNADRDIPIDLLGMNFPGAVGARVGGTPTDYKWSLSTGGSHQFENGLALGGSLTVFYERDSLFYDDGVDDAYWVSSPGGPLIPETSQVQGPDDFRSSLFDVTRGSRSVQWGTLLTFGLEYQDHTLDFTYLYSKTTEDVATIAQDTRSKAFFFPGYDPNDPTSPGYDQPDAAPYLRLETLQYTERATDSLQLRGHHPILTGQFGPFHDPEVDWSLAFSSASSDQPDKRQFGAEWRPEREIFPGFSLPAEWRPFKPDANFTLGNLQRIWKTIDEESDQFAINLKLPFETWHKDGGHAKFGFFMDRVDRTFDQETFSNFGDQSSYPAPFEQPWSQVFPGEPHPIFDGPPFVDVDYEGELDVTAWFAMLDLPVLDGLTLRGGVRFEKTAISIINDPEADATWFPPGSPGSVALNPGEADVAFKQSDVLPSVSLEYQPIPDVTLRAAYNQTIARQTFKELTPILQQEFLGGPVFIGNPELQMSAVKNYDLRVDYTPFAGGLLSASWFHKDITNPIEYVQRFAPFNFTFPVNYPEGKLGGFEFEARQKMGEVWSPLEGLTIGANATFISSEVRLPDDEVAEFNLPNINVPTTKRDMTNAPEHLYNFFLTYDLESTGTRVSLFYTVEGDALQTGAGVSQGNYIPDLYRKGVDNLNFSVSQRIGDHFRLQFQAKNLTNPDIRTVYRSDVLERDVTQGSFSRGVEFSISLSAEFTF